MLSVPGLEHTVELHLAVEKDKLAMHSATRMNPKCTMLREKADSGYILYDSIIFQTVWKRQNCQVGGQADEWLPRLKSRSRVDHTFFVERVVEYSVF